MNIGNIEYCEKVYNFLLAHNLYEQVINNHMLYPYLEDKDKSANGPINDLFHWGKSPEGHAFWSTVNSKVPTALKHRRDITVIEIFDYLIQKRAPQAYEYW